MLAVQMNIKIVKIKQKLVYIFVCLFVALFDPFTLVAFLTLCRLTLGRLTLCYLTLGRLTQCHLTLGRLTLCHLTLGRFPYVGESKVKPILEFLNLIFLI